VFRRLRLLLPWGSAAVFYFVGFIGCGADTAVGQRIEPRTQQVNTNADKRFSDKPMCEQSDSDDCASAVPIQSVSSKPRTTAENSNETNAASTLESSRCGFRLRSRTRAITPYRLSTPHYTERRRARGKRVLRSTALLTSPPIFLQALFAKSYKNALVRPARVLFCRPNRGSGIAIPAFGLYGHEGGRRDASKRARHKRVGTVMQGWRWNQGRDTL
jgi:hypothetical protein